MYIMAERVVQDNSKLINLINDLNLYIKFLEQRILKIELDIRSINDRIENLNRIIERYEKTNEENFNNIKDKLDSLENEIEKVKVELRKKADLSEMKELKALIETFNPLKSIFVTREEVKRIINELINIKRE